MFDQRRDGGGGRVEKNVYAGATSRPRKGDDYHMLTVEMGRE